jgi:uncharacterized protein
VDAGQAALLIVGGLAAGVLNALAGGGSLLTVPLLTFAGLPGGMANGTNRVGVVVMNSAAAWSFRWHGVSVVGRVGPVLVPTLIGSLVGAVTVAQLSDETFERLFGLIMIPLLLLSLRPPRAAVTEVTDPWPRWVSALVFGGIGLYGGAFQAGVGLFLTVALARSGIGLVRANAVKVVVILALTAVVVPVFILAGQVDWTYALVLSVGFGAGGAFGARVAVRGGERVIRPVLVAAVMLLALRMLGLW